MTDDDGKRVQVGVVVTLRDIGGGKTLGAAIMARLLALNGRKA
jgi:hypothetical protein